MTQWDFCMSSERLDLLFRNPSNLKQSSRNSAGMAGSQDKGGPGASVGYRGMPHVFDSSRSTNLEVSDLISNYLPIGAGHEAKNAMLFFGAMRYVVPARIVVSQSPSLTDILYDRSNTSW